MLARNMAEGDCRPQRNPAARIIATHNAQGVVASGIEAGNRPAIAVQNPCPLVGPQAGKCAKVSNKKLYGMEMTLEI